tara:strand:+ start:797 stop:1318 length:522 start_codon:yes stop_codon:yes gene_type:complete
MDNNIISALNSCTELRVLNNARIVLEEEHTILKIYLNPNVFHYLRTCIWMMGVVHSDLLVEEYEDEKVKWLRTKKIMHTRSHVRTYEENVKNYLTLRDQHRGGGILVKRDLGPSNILYRIPDGKFYIIDWDDYYELPESKLKSHYKSELTDGRWQDQYDASHEDLSTTFEKLW